jgi:hypothetical protein
MSEKEYWEDHSRDPLHRDSMADVAVEPDLDLAIQRREAGDLEGSLGMLRALVAARMRRQGRKGFDTQCALSQQGRTLRAMGRAAEASDLHWEVLAIRFELYGRFSGFTRNSAGILADTLGMLNDPEMAAAIRLWLRPPDSPSSTDLMAIMRVDARMNDALATRQAYVTRQVAKLVRGYLGRPIRNRI